jgi:hypothetical protein
LKWLGRFFESKAGHSDARVGANSEPSRSLEIATGHVPDLVDGLNALAAYYRFEEADAYASSLHSTRERRDFRPELLSRIQVLLAYASDEHACGQIDHELSKNAAALDQIQPTIGSEDLAAEARLLDPKGFALLALSAPLTTESLKQGYRDAAKAHHPDVGGDNATMLRVNSAYALFAALINRRVSEAIVNDVQWRVECLRASDVMLRARVRRFEGSVDDMAADSAFDYYIEMALPNMPSAFNEAGIVSRLCELLAAAGLIDHARRVLGDLRLLVDEAATRQLNFGMYYERASSALSEPGKVRFIPNHARQAANLLRLKIIDEKRYASILERVGIAAAELGDDVKAFALFVKTLTFLTLPLDPAVVPIPIGLVPAPDYYGRVESLSEAQRAEYAGAYHGVRPDLAEKYLAIRFDALMRSAILGYGDIGALIAETTALADAPGCKPALNAVGVQAVRMLSFLQSLPKKERSARFESLLGLDGDPRGPLELRVATNGMTVSSARPIVVTPSYVDFATSSIERILLFTRTGSDRTAEEKAEDALRFAERRAFYEAPVYLAAREAAFAKVKDPERIIATASTLWDAMYERLGGAAPEADDFGYWSDRISINLVKLGRPKDALRWIDRFETLPESVKARTTESMRESLHNRRVRCQKASDAIA